MTEPAASGRVMRLVPPLPSDGGAAYALEVPLEGTFRVEITNQATGAVRRFDAGEPGRVQWVREPLPAPLAQHGAALFGADSAGWRVTAETPALFRELEAAQRAWTQAGHATYSELVPPDAAPPAVPDPFRGGQAAVGSGLAVKGLFDAIHHAGTRRDWDDGDGQMPPTHTTRVARGGGAIYVSLRGADGAAVPPQETIPFLWEQVAALGDWASDALCVCLALAEERERGGHAPAAPFWVTADRILDGRGIKRITRSGEPGNWQHGHRREDRIKAGQALGQLQGLWLQADIRLTREGSRQAKRLTVNSRALAITDLTSQQELAGGAMFLSARIVFGEWASAYWEHGLRQTAILARQALEYDPYREQPEKRLAKFLAFQFRRNARGGRPRLPLRVATLLDEAGLALEARKPQRTRDRLEQALSRLGDDGVIAGWAYKDDPEGLPARKWAPVWLRRTVWVELPAALAAQYQSLLARTR